MQSVGAHGPATEPCEQLPAIQQEVMKASASRPVLRLLLLLLLATALLVHPAVARPEKYQSTFNKSW
jgi:hypothetical protein